MPRLNDRVIVRLAIIGVLAATLGLAGCGRKGPLELPPSAAASQPDAAAKSAQRAAAASAAAANEDDDLTDDAAGFSRKQKKQRGPKKPFFLDPLID